MRESHLVQTDDNLRIALDWTIPDDPRGNRTAVFVHGFASNRQGEKATFFAERFQARGWHFMSFDMRGHGDSEGSMATLTLSGCIADLGAALDWLPEEMEPPLLIASSMGGAVAGWYHILHPARVGAMACIAPSFTFPSHLPAELGAEEMAKWREQGLRRFQNEWLNVEIGYGLITDAQQYDQGRLVREYIAPTIIFHGMQDDAVDWRASLAFVEDCPWPQLDLLLIKQGDHRLTDQKTYMFDCIMAWLEHQT